MRLFVHDDTTGLLAPPGDTHAWTEMLRRASISPDSRKRWSLASRKVAEERFAWPQVARVFEAILARPHVVPAAAAADAAAARAKRAPT
jgi:hypothetical protein